MVGPAVQVKVLSTDDAVPSEADAALALVHRLDDVAEEDALSKPVAAVAVVLAGVIRFTHLQARGWKSACRRSLCFKGLVRWGIGVIQVILLE